MKMTKQMIALLSLLTICTAATDSYSCYQYASQKYSYQICNSVNVQEFTDARDVCKREGGESSDLVTFPTKEEYELLVDKLNTTQSDDFVFLLGLVHHQVFDDPFYPETGNYSWVTSEDKFITVDSDSYWQPFSEFITDFPNLETLWKQKQYLVMNQQGRPLKGLSINFNGKFDDRHGPIGVVCSQKLLPSPTPTPSIHSLTPDWKQIAIIAGGAVAALILIIAIVCVVRKVRGSPQNPGGTKFAKVPQNV